MYVTGRSATEETATLVDAAGGRDHMTGENGSRPTGNRCHGCLAVASASTYRGDVGRPASRDEYGIVVVARVHRRGIAALAADSALVARVARDANRDSQP